MEAIDRKFNSVKNRGGSALILVVVLTVLLALIGAMFMLMSRIDEMSTKSIKPDQLLDAATEKIIDKFSEVLVEDIYGNGSSPFKFDTSASFGSKSNEPWDYPSFSDPWLACLQPIDLDPDPANFVPGFIRITDLYNMMGGAANNLQAEIIADDAAAALGDPADADGDGVSDSRWIRLRYLATEKGEKIYAAVRIIDNGGMININTALRDPGSLTVPGNWDGSQLSHVNLEGGFISDTDVTDGLDASYMQAMRYGTIAVAAPYDYISDIEYEVNAARRLNHPAIIAPGEIFVPFDIGDELVLRNRFFLSSSFRKNGTVIRPAVALPATFNPQADPGKGLPYKLGDDIALWYKKVGPDSIGSSNRRHYSTVVSRENPAVRPYDPTKVTAFPASMDDATPLNEEQKIGISLPLDVQDGTASPVVKDNFIKRLAMGIYRGLPDDDSIIEDRFGTDSTNNPFYDREQLAWQMAVNMVDYQDKDASGDETVTTYHDEVTKTTYYGTESLEALKKNTVCISKIGYFESGTPSAYYYGIEVFNPDDDTTVAPKNLLDYKIIVIDDQGDYKGEFNLSGTVEDSGSTDGANDTRVFVFNDSGKTFAETRSELGAIPPRSTFITPYPFSDATKGGNLLESGDKLIVINTALDMPVDCITVPSKFKANTVVLRRVVLPGTNFLLPSTSDVDTWELRVPGFGTNLGSPLDPDPDGGAEEAELIEPQDSFDPDVQELQLAGVQLAETDKPLSNIGEIENVLAVGTRYMYDDNGTAANKNDDEYECMTLIQALTESLAAVTGAGTPGYDPADDQESGIDMKTFGRIRLMDTDFTGLLDSLTYFDPARDGVDLQNAAEGIVPTMTGSIDGGTLDTLTDGEFLKADTAWDNGTVYWTDPITAIEIDLGAPQQIWGVIVQADHNDDYVLDFHDGTSWIPIMLIENHDISGTMPGGMQTRPDVYDDGKWQLFDEPVFAQRFRVRANDTAAPLPEFSLSEIQLGVSLTPFEPHYSDTIAGRININTAPWYAINQLPWMEDASAAEPGSLAQAAVAFRDRKATPLAGVDYSAGRSSVTGIDPADIDVGPGFKNISQLMQVINKDPLLVDFDIRKKIFDGADAVDGDYTPDTAIDDFEERNLIFHRISNLVTVRSDVFTAYILVRIGENGPQRRMIAILDRSGVNSPGDKPKILAIQPVADAR